MTFNQDAGNKAFSAKLYGEAIEYYTKAIGLDLNNHVLYSNSKFDDDF